MTHQSLPDWVGGVEIYTQGLAKALIAQGHPAEVFVCEPKAGGTPALITDVYDGVTVNRFLTPPRTETQQWLASFGEASIEAAFAQVLERFRPAVVHFQHLLGLPTELVAMTQRWHIPICLTLHDYWFLCANTKLLTNYNEQVCTGPRAWVNCGMCALAKLGLPGGAVAAPLLAPVFAFREWYVRRILPLAEVLIAPTDFVREKFIERGTPAEQIRVIASGIEPPPLSASPVPDQGPLRVAYVGGVARLKGVHVLIEAFQALPPDAQLRVAGDLARQPEYAHRLQQKARHPGVRFLGQQSRTELWHLLNWADIVVVPSVWYEVAPLIIYEAFAMRRPVVASRLGSLAGLVRHDVDGLLIPPGDSQAWGEALLDLARQRERLVAMQAAIRPVKTVVEHAQELVELYAQLAKRQSLTV